MQAHYVTPAKTGIVWPHIEAWVTRAQQRGNANQSPEDIRQHLERGTMQLWLVWSDRPVGCCVTEIVNSPRGRFCNLVAVGGDGWRSWAHLLKDIEQWAKGHGCVRLAMTGRKGWARRLAGDGWQEASVTLERSIDG